VPEHEGRTAGSACQLLIGSTGELPVLPFRGARPGPGFRSLDKACRNGILFDITDNPPQLSVSADPMIPTFILAECLTRESQEFVRFAGRRFLHPAHNLRHIGFWGDQDVNVTGHNHPGMNSIEVPLDLASCQSISYESRDPRISQMVDAAGLPLQLPTLGDEAKSRIRGDKRTSDHRDRPTKTPRQKQSCAVRLQMRQVPPVFGHISTDSCRL
jgi:hypothetical protein